jgi:hypothetical protein
MSGLVADPARSLSCAVDLGGGEPLTAPVHARRILEDQQYEPRCRAGQRD